MQGNWFNAFRLRSDGSRVNGALSCLFILGLIIYFPDTSFGTTRINTESIETVLVCGTAPDPMHDYSGYATWCQCIGGEIYIVSYGAPACRMSGRFPPPHIIFQTDGAPKLSAEKEVFLHAYNLEQGGRDNAAIKTYREAIKYNNRYAAAYNNLGLIYKGHGEYQRAIGLYRKAIKYAEEDINRERARGNLRAVLLEQGYCYWKEKNLNKAKSSFQSVRSIYPGDTEATLGLTWIHAKEANSELPQYPKEHHQCPAGLSGGGRQ